MGNFEKQPPKELKEIKDMRHGRDLTELRKKMLKETEEGIEELFRKDAEKGKASGSDK